MKYYSEELLKDLISKLPGDINIKISNHLGKIISYFKSVSDIKEDSPLLDKAVIVYQYQEDLIQGEYSSTNPYINRYINIILK